MIIGDTVSRSRADVDLLDPHPSLLITYGIQTGSLFQASETLVSKPIANLSGISV